MSHSVPSESSATDTTFIVGADLVQFDRHELPIYQTPESKWAEACFDERVSLSPSPQRTTSLVCPKRIFFSASVRMPPAPGLISLAMA